MLSSVLDHPLWCIDEEVQTHYLYILASRSMYMITPFTQVPITHLIFNQTTCHSYVNHNSLVMGSDRQVH
jgi:hypothetical protein